MDPRMVSGYHHHTRYSGKYSRTATNAPLPTGGDKFFIKEKRVRTCKYFFLKLLLPVTCNLYSAEARDAESSPLYLTVLKHLRMTHIYMYMYIYPEKAK